MNRIMALLAVALLAGCAAQEETMDSDKEQAIRDYIASRQLAEADRIRTRSRDRTVELDPTFVLYKTINGSYLIEFAQACRALIDGEVIPDVRLQGETIRARSDTLRGCRIQYIYTLADHEATELENIGDSTGSHE